MNVHELRKHQEALFLYLCTVFMNVHELGKPFDPWILYLCTVFMNVHELGKHQEAEAIEKNMRAKSGSVPPAGYQPAPQVSLYF